MIRVFLKRIKVFFAQNIIVGKEKDELPCISGIVGTKKFLASAEHCIGATVDVFYLMISLH